MALYLSSFRCRRCDDATADFSVALRQIDAYRAAFAL